MPQIRPQQARQLTVFSALAEPLASLDRAGAENRYSTAWEAPHVRRKARQLIVAGFAGIQLPVLSDVLRMVNSAGIQSHPGFRVEIELEFGFSATRIKDGRMSNRKLYRIKLTVEECAYFSATPERNRYRLPKGVVK